MEDGVGMSVEFELTRQDYIACCAAVDRRDLKFAKLERYQPVFTVMTVILTIGLAALAIYHAASRNSGIHGMVWLLGAGVIVLCWWAVRRMSFSGQVASLREDYEREADAWHTRASYGPTRVTLRRAYLGWMNPAGEVRKRWLGGGVVERVEGFVLVSVGRGQLFPIPLRAFASEAEIERFMQTARAFRDMAGLSFDEAVAELLRDRDFACRGCRYNLRGVREARCPECGRGISEEEIEAVEQSEEEWRRTGDEV
jgi:hypothetical protein